MHRPILLTGLLLLSLTAGCLSLKAEPARDFQYALQIDSLAEISFAEGDMRGCISLWLEAAEIADRYAATEQDSLTYSGFLQSLGVCYRRISMMDSTLYYYNRAWDIIQDKTSPAAVSEKTRLLTSMAMPTGQCRWRSMTPTWRWSCTRLPTREASMPGTGSSTRARRPCARQWPRPVRADCRTNSSRP